MKYIDEEDMIAEYERQLQKKDNEIKRLKEEYVMLQNASDKVEEEKDKEIERLNKENSDLQNIANIEISKSEFLEKEIERLNNIINELEEIIKEYGSAYLCNKFKELKEDNNE